MALYYVDKAATGLNDGSSWTDAWNEMDQIDWASLVAGDTVYVKGGVYSTAVTINSVNGASGNPITIEAVGQVFWTGGRTVLLPYWDSTESWTDDASLSRLIFFQTCSHIVFDGKQWDGFVLHGCSAEAIRFENAADNITLRYLTIHNNGWADDADATAAFQWESDGRGIRISGANNRLEYCRIHDNGQDAIQTRHDSSLADLTLYRCHLFNYRQHPTQAGGSYNWDAHTDGLHVHEFGTAGGVVDGITIDQCVIGPGLTNGVILGEGSNGTDTTNVTVTDCVFLLCTDNFMHCQSGASSSAWTIDQCTFLAHTQITGGFNAIHANGDATITDCVFLSADTATMAIDVSGALTSSGNVWSGLSGDAIGGTNVDPDFVTDPTGNFLWGNWEPQAAAADGKGCRYFYTPEELYAHGATEAIDTENDFRSTFGDLDFLIEYPIPHVDSEFADYWHGMGLYRAVFPTAVSPPTGSFQPAWAAVINQVIS